MVIVGLNRLHCADGLMIHMCVAQVGNTDSLVGVQLKVVECLRSGVLRRCL